MSFQVNEHGALAPSQLAGEGTADVHDSRRAAERSQQAIQALIADDLTCSDRPGSDRYIADALVWAFDVVMQDIRFDVMPEMLLRQEDDMVETS